jgi:hypothetical protein
MFNSQQLFRKTPKQSKMKKLRAFPLLILALLGFVQAQAQVTADLKIRNQRIVGSTYYFDLYIERTGSNNLFLGNADFVFTFDNSNFSSPTFSYTASSAVLKNTTGSAINSYESNIATSIGTGLNANRLIINVQPPAFSNQTQFDANIAKIDNSTQAHYLGTFTITGMQNASQFPNLQWKTSGSGVVTKVFTIANTSTWRSSQATVTGVNPTPTTEPGTQSTNLRVTATTTTSATLNVHPGNGAYRIILAKASSAVSTNHPTDGVNYTANAAFGSGSQIGSSGVYVVYKGTDTAVTVTGLTAGTTYHFASYEFSGTDGTTENFNTTNPATTSTSTLAAEPTLQASAVTFSSPTTSALTVTFTKGNGSNHIVLMKSAGAVNADPVDGTSYTASTTFASGTQIGTGNYVVYNGTDSVVTITGLTANTVYHVAVYDFNGSSGTENYLITSPATGNRTTLQTEPTISASSLLVNGATTTSLNLTWNNGNGARKIVVAKSGSAVSVNPADGAGYTAGSFTAGQDLGSGNIVVYDGTDTTTTVTGLTANTTYHFAVYEYNGSSSAQNYKTSSPATGNGSTLLAEPTQQSTDLAFNTFGTTTLNFSFTEGDGSSRIILMKAAGAVDATPTDGTGYTASTTFGSGTQIGTGNYVVSSGAGTNVTVTGLSANTVYHVAIFEYNGSTTTANYLTTSPLTGSRTTLQTEPTTQVTSFTASNPSGSTIDLAWSGGTGARRIVVAKSGSAVSVNPTDGNTYTAGSFTTGTDLGSGNIVVYDGTGSSATVTGLTQNTTYHFAVYVYDGVSGAENYNTTSPKTTSANTYMTLAATVLLEGPYNGTNMDASVNANGDLPLSNPYDTTGWHYSGAVSVSNGFFTTHTNIVDWVYVEFRKSASGAANADESTVKATVPGFLLQNGSIVALDGSSAITAPLTESGTYYIVINQRNHLPVMSNNSITSNGTNYTYNFTTGSTQAYGTNAQIDLGSGVYGMYSGRVETATSANDIDAADRSAAWTARNSTGYQVTDCTLDGVVDAADRSVILNNSGKSSQVPQ